MNISEGTNSSRELTCWESFGNGSGERNNGQNALLGILLVLAICNLVGSVWCVIASLSTPKLRKPTWIFKSSMAMKDAMFAIAMSGYALWNILRTSQQHEVTVGKTETQSLFDLGEFICNVIFLMGISSSFIHILLITFDRHQVIARPFRYHTGELLPSNLAYVLSGAGWTFSFVIALTITTQSLEDAERDMKVTYVGALFPIYRIPVVQKWLLGAGLCLIYSVAAGLFAEAFVIEWVRAKKRKAQLFSGVGELEPVRSRNNSVCQSTKKRKNNAGVEESRTNSEADANEFLLTAGGFGQDLSKKDEANEEAFIFTPVNYRPSLRRRIRDTWSLYSAMICFIGFTILVLIPFFVILLADEPQARPLGNSQTLTTKPYSYCVGVSFTECLLMMQGFAYVIVYVIIDDVFRPHFLRPFNKLQHKEESKIFKAIQYSSSTSILKI